MFFIVPLQNATTLSFMRLLEQIRVLNALNVRKYTVSIAKEMHIRAGHVKNIK